MTALPGIIPGAIEVAVNRLLDGDPELRAECAALDGRSIVLEIEDLGVALSLVFTGDGVLVPPQPVAEPDVRVSGKAMTLVRLLRAGAAGGALPQGVRVAGDVGLLETIRQLARHADFDLEELLATVLPGAAAHRAADILRRAGRWSLSALRTLGLDTVEYLREETGDLVHRAEIEEWMDEVDALRDAVDRAEARLVHLGERLERRA